MGNTMKRVGAAVFASAAIATGGVLVAPAAHAAPVGVADGDYNYVVRTQQLFGLLPDLLPDQVTNDQATVRNNVLTVNSGGTVVNYQIQPTEYGGLADFGPARMVFARNANGEYSGTVYGLGIPVAWNTLFPR